MAYYQFNTDTVPESERGFDLLPAGEYLAMIEETEIKANSKGTGQVLKMKWKVQEGDKRGRVVFDQINLTHRESAQAEQIGQQQLKAICFSVGLQKGFTDTNQLHNRPCIIKVAVELSKDPQYSDKNIVKGYKQAQGAGQLFNQMGAQQAPAGTPPAAAQQAPAAQMVAPWLQK